MIVLHVIEESRHIAPSDRNEFAILPQRKDVAGQQSLDPAPGAQAVGFDVPPGPCGRNIGKGFSLCLDGR